MSRFQRSRLTQTLPVGGSFDANGDPTTATTVLRAAYTDLIFGNGSSTEIVSDGQGGTRNVTTVDLPAAYGTGFNDAAVLEGLVGGATQIFVHVFNKALGGAALTGITLRVDFQDPHYGFWLPSKEGVARDQATIATYDWACNGADNSFIVATRVEHAFFKRFRVLFKKSAGNVDAATRIYTSWFPSGAPSLSVTEP